ncbi:cytochrome c3 family protein [Campylobacter sp. faydin G-140]|uniref:cytochrome c3 family protein n=1 Tax=Campylobacter anatolicus TaxID=2829105 RepID=UPI001B9A1E3E|nr:cytochrome c3 family protein [Campylobacter anatolicus]MBR8465980.1 cytochrome c3 family protein [Campylobacter anatolicus]
MKKFMFLLSFFTILLNATDLHQMSLAKILRDSNGEIVTNFSKETFAIKGIHQKLGLDCTDCHKEPDEKMYSSAMNNSCLECHGSYAKLGERTGALGHNDNIHASPHFEALDCDTCHKSHKPSVNMCLRCHTQDSIKNLEVR